MKQKTYNSIDLIKFIMAFAVIAMHTEPLTDCANEKVLTLYNNLVTMAVPFFFLASGYLMAKRMSFPYTGSDISVIKKHLGKIWKLYIMWMFIYAPLAVYKYAQWGNEIKSQLSAYLPSSVSYTRILDEIWTRISMVIFMRGFFLVGEQYNSWHLWYLLVTVYSLWCIIFLLKKNITPKGLLAVSAVCAVVSAALDWIAFDYADFPTVIKLFGIAIKLVIGNGRLFRGLVYIPVGMYLANKKPGLILSAVVMVLGYGANYFVENPMISEIFLIITSIALFGVIVNIELKDSTVYPVLRNMSTTIYFTHMYIWTLYYMIVYGVKTSGWDAFVVTAIEALLVAVVYWKLTGRNKVKE